MAGSCHFSIDPKRPRACSIVLPSGRRVDLSEEPDGRIRIRFPGRGPMTISEFTPAGRRGETVLTLGSPEAKAIPEEAAPKPRTFVAKELTDLGPIMSRDGVTLKDIAEGRARRRKV